MDFTILNWNIGGAKYLEEPQDRRSGTRTQLNKELRQLMETFQYPHVITLQEVVRHQEPNQALVDLLDHDLQYDIDGNLDEWQEIGKYHYYPLPLIGTDDLSAQAKWNKVKRSGNWHPQTMFSQGNAILIRKDVPRAPVWGLPRDGSHDPVKTRPWIEKVPLERGLYFGDRNTEPRAAFVVHLVFEEGGRPLDIFVVCLHFTTLMKEREGIPEIDRRASAVRLQQLSTVFDGIVSRYNEWRVDGYKDRGEARVFDKDETDQRYEPVWVLAGDFNFTLTSEEYHTVEMMNFMDAVPNKNCHTKAKGAGKKPTLTLDYIFAGPEFIALDPLIARDGVKANRVAYPDALGSDHYPLWASIPMTLP